MQTEVNWRVEPVRIAQNNWQKQRWSAILVVKWRNETQEWMSYVEAFKWHGVVWIYVMHVLDWLRGRFEVRNMCIHLLLMWRCFCMCNTLRFTLHNKPCEREMQLGGFIHEFCSSLNIDPSMFSVSWITFLILTVTGTTGITLSLSFSFYFTPKMGLCAAVILRDWIRHWQKVSGQEPMTGHMIPFHIA